MSAREDYPAGDSTSAKGVWIGRTEYMRAMDEIDRLRVMVNVLTRTDDKTVEIQQVADSINLGVSTCGATWFDDQPHGWLWYCSLPVGHAGHHKCIGASW